MNLKAGHFTKKRCPAFFKHILELIKELKMKITRCKYGHYYDKAYFRECPHCCRERGGRDEDIIIARTEQTGIVSGKNGLSGEAQNGIRVKGDSQKEKDRENVKRWIGEAWDELEEILSEDNESDKKIGISNETAKREIEKADKKAEVEDRISEQDIEKESKKEKRKEEAKEEFQDRKKEHEGVKKENPEKKSRESYMIFAAMPLKVIKNQEFCMDFCLLPEVDWETGVKMLEFKSQESIRDLKPVKMSSPTNAVLHILYKDEEILSKEIVIEGNQEKVFCTFPVTVTDTRDRRFHMIKVIFEIAEQGIEVPLYLMPNP